MAKNKTKETTETANPKETTDIPTADQERIAVLEETVAKLQVNAKRDNARLEKLEKCNCNKKKKPDVEVKKIAPANTSFEYELEDEEGAKMTATFDVKLVRFKNPVKPSEEIHVADLVDGAGKLKNADDPATCKMIDKLIELQSSVLVRTDEGAGQK